MEKIDKDITKTSIHRNTSENGVKCDNYYTQRSNDFQISTKLKDLHKTSNDDEGNSKNALPTHSEISDSTNESLVNIQFNNTENESRSSQLPSDSSITSLINQEHFETHCEQHNKDDRVDKTDIENKANFVGIKEDREKSFQLNDQEISKDQNFLKRGIKLNYEDSESNFNPVKNLDSCWKPNKSKHLKKDNEKTLFSPVSNNEEFKNSGSNNQIKDDCQTNREVNTYEFNLLSNLPHFHRINASSTLHCVPSNLQCEAVKSSDLRRYQCPHHQYNENSCIHTKDDNQSTGKYPLLNIESPPNSYSNIMCMLKPAHTNNSSTFEHEPVDTLIDKSDLLKRLTVYDSEYSSAQATTEESIKSNCRFRKELNDVDDIEHNPIGSYENQSSSHQENDRYSLTPQILLNNGLNVYLRSNWPAYTPVDAVVSTYAHEQNNPHHFTDLSRSSIHNSPSSWSSAYNNLFNSNLQQKPFLSSTDMPSLENEMCQQSSLLTDRKKSNNDAIYNTIEDSTGLIHCPVSKCSFHEDILFFNTSNNPLINSCHQRIQSKSDSLHKTDMHNTTAKKLENSCKAMKHNSNCAKDVQLQQRRSHPSTQNKSPLNIIASNDLEISRVERKRQRNRIAARKCRTKKLERIAELEAKVKELNAQNKELENEAIQLKLQFYQLREILIEHYKSGGCELQEGKDICRSNLDQLTLSGH